MIGISIYELKSQNTELILQTFKTELAQDEE